MALVDPNRLRAYLEVLRDAGVKRAKVPLADGARPGTSEAAIEGWHLEVEFAGTEKPSPVTMPALPPEGPSAIDLALNPPRFTGEQG